MTAPVLLRGRCLDESGERDCIIQFDGLDKIVVTVADGPIPAIGSRMVCSSPQLGLLTFNVAAMDDVTQEHVIECMKELRAILIAAKQPTIHLQNNAVMPEVSVAALDRKLTELTTKDFFLKVTHYKQNC